MAEELPPSEGKPDKYKGLLEYGPIIVFVAIYFYLRRSQPDTAIYPAALIFSVLAVIALIISWIRSKSLPLMLVFTTAIIIITTGLAFFFDDPRFIYRKPTVIYLASGIGLLAGLLLKKNFIRLLFGGAFELPQKSWTVLTILWTVFFFAMAGLNEFVWQSYGEAFWMKFKLFGFIPLTLLFTFAQIPYIMKHGKFAGQDGNAE